VGKLAMESELVEKSLEHEVLGLRPRYLCYNLWTLDANLMITAVEWTLLVKLLPQPLSNEYENSLVNQTISDYPDIFKIVTLSRSVKTFSAISSELRVC